MGLHHRGNSIDVVKKDHPVLWRGGWFSTITSTAFLSIVWQLHVRTHNVRVCAASDDRQLARQPSLSSYWSASASDLLRVRAGRDIDNRSVAVSEACSPRVKLHEVQQLHYVSLVRGRSVSRLILKAVNTRPPHVGSLCLGSIWCMLRRVVKIDAGWCWTC